VSEGYRQACLDHGLDPEAHLHALEMSSVLAVHSFDPSLVWNIHAPRRIPWPAEEPFVTSVRANPQVTAILAPNDPAAVLMHFLLTREGWRVPEDISLVGFDDTEPLYNAEDDNILTTVRMPLEEAGAVAARLLTDRIEGREPHDRQIVLPTELIVRGTTAAPKVMV
jgi:LacI family transcriptional regulator